MAEDFCDCGQYCCFLNEDGHCCFCQMLEEDEMCSECREALYKERDTSIDAIPLIHTIEFSKEVKEVFDKERGETHG